MITWAPDPFPTIWIGLGNPDAHYARTRHNYGKIGIELFKNLLGTSHWRDLKDASVSLSAASLGKKQLLLAKSNSYMNLSGAPTAWLLKKEQVSPQQLLVLHDDLDLPAGTLRLKFGGSCGGHNGLKDIARAVKTPNFWRLRVGISRPLHRLEIVNYVLSKAPEEEHRKITDALLSFFEENLRSWREESK